MQVEQWLIERMMPPVQYASILHPQSWDDALAGKSFQRMCFPTVWQPPQPGTVHFIYLKPVTSLCSWPPSRVRHAPHMSYAHTYVLYVCTFVRMYTHTWFTNSFADVCKLYILGYQLSDWVYLSKLFCCLLWYYTYITAVHCTTLCLLC